MRSVSLIDPALAISYTCTCKKYKDEGFVWAGQVVGLMHDIPAAKELIERTVWEAWEIVEKMRRMY